MKMKFKEGTQVEIAVAEDFPICARSAGGNVFSLLSYSYQFGIEAGKHIGIIQGSSHYVYQGYYSVKIKVCNGFYVLLDVSEKKCHAIKTTKKSRGEPHDD